mgnify:CR=1 FL=1
MLQLFSEHSRQSFIYRAQTILLRQLGPDNWFHRKVYSKRKGLVYSHWIYLSFDSTWRCFLLHCTFINSFLSMNSNLTHLFLPNCQCTIIYRDPKLFSALPSGVQHSSSYPSFKWKLRNRLLSYYRIAMWYLNSELYYFGLHSVSTVLILCCCFFVML